MQLLDAVTSSLQCQILRQQLHISQQRLQHRCPSKYLSLSLIQHDLPGQHGSNIKAQSPVR